MEDSTWDPLFSFSGADSDFVADAQRRQIKNILKSYVGMYDPFSELLQNALDAVDRRLSDEGKGFKPKLWIKVDLQENSFSVTDNGVGFKEQEFKSFLAPNISFKSGRGSRGSKGVGATYIAYGFDYLRFATKSGDFEFCGEINHGRIWVDDDSGVEARPVVKRISTLPSALDSIDRGSSFTIRFGGPNTRPKSLAWYQATTAQQWLYLLLIRTPLGAVRFLLDDGEGVAFDLEVVDQSGVITRVDDQGACYFFPHLKINSSVDLQEVRKYQAGLAAAGKDSSVLPPKYSKMNGLYEFFSTGDLLKLRSWASESGAESVIKQYEVEAYGYFAYSTAVWDQLNDNVAKLRKGYRILRGGLQMANNRMIQGDLLVIPLTSSTGYQNQAYVIVHFKNADPDLGRKGFQPELKAAAELISVAIVNSHKKWRSRLLKSDTGARPNIERELELHEWIKQQEEHEKNNPLVISNKNFFAPVEEISISSIPQSEQDVIVLFNQLVAGGVIRGLRLLATNQVKQYDGVFKFSVKEPFENHVFDKEKNPLGVVAGGHQKAVLSAPKVLEYKFSIDGLIHEFESGEKSEKDIHLAVAWELGTEWSRSYEVLSLLDLDNIHQRDFHGITHVLNSGTTQFNVIALRELVEYLNDVDGVQQYHKVSYGGALV